MAKKISFAAVAHDLVNMPVNQKDTLVALRKRFYRIMRKHNVKQGTRLPDGRIRCNNPEWQAAEDIYAQRVHSELNLMSLLNAVPNDLIS